MGTRSNLKFESPPNPRGILALIDQSNQIIQKMRSKKSIIKCINVT